MVDNAFARLDSEHQLKAHRSAIECVRSNPARQFRDAEFKIIHPHELKREFTEEGGTWFLRTQNVRPMRIDRGNTVFLPSEIARTLKRNVVRRDDILLTRTGANRGDCALFDTDEAPVASSHTFIIRNEGWRHAYLMAFFNSSYGRAQIDKGVYGAAQPEIAPFYLERIWVPLASDKLQGEVTRLIERASAAAARSTAALEEAENSFLGALGLGDWSPPEPLTYTRAASALPASKRLDAEFSAPKVQALLEWLSRTGNSVGSAANVRREPFRPKPPGSFRYIEIGDLDGFGRCTSSEVDLAEAPSRATWHVRAGDVLTSTVRPLRRLSAIVAPDQEGYVCSSGFVVLDPCEVSPELLMTYLRLPLVCELMHLFATASMYPALSEADLLALPMPHVEEGVDRLVQQRVQNSAFQLRKSERLLEVAKRAVEIAVENDEAAALRFISEQGEASDAGSA